MKLPFSFFHNKEKQESEYYLALLLTDEKVSAMILQESLGKVKAIGKHEEFFLTSLEFVDLEELINIVDKTISTAEKVLPPNIETHKTVFGVKESWVESDTKKITKEYLAKLKKVCDALDLTPIGFMVVTEALANLLQEEEGAPLSAILAEIGKKTVTLTLFRGGKIVEKIDGALEESAVKTVDTLLKHFTTAVLPARIILYDAKDGEKLSQHFITHQWSKGLPFIHVPQITLLPAETDTKAVVFGAASQMGFEIVGMDLKIKAPEEREETKETDDNEKKDTTEEKTSSSSISADNFGFVQDEDITKIQPAPSLQQSDELEEENEKIQRNESSFEVNLHQQEETTPAPHVTSKLPHIFAGLGAIHFPKINIPFPMKGNNRIIMPLSILACLLIICGILAYIYLYKTNVHIILSVIPKMVDQNANVTFSSTSPSDFSQNIIAATPLTTTVDGSMTIDTTGKKDVGNKAKGTVTVYNNDSSPISLDSGTAIKSSNGLIFLIDKAINIASASGDIFSGTKPGTQDVSVTAKDIGTDSNLPSGTKFSIGTNPNLAAKNDNAFSGGTKKQIQVVSSADIAKLKADLPKSLTSKANDAIAQKASDSETMIPLLITAGLNKPQFDNQVNDEAKQVKLTATVAFEAFAYDNTEVNNYGKSLLKDKYSQDISDKSIKNTIKNPTQKNDNQIQATLAITAGLLPDIDTNDVANKIKIMSLQQAKTFISGLPQIASNQITFSPNIPLLPNLFPHLPGNISIEIKPE